MKAEHRDPIIAKVINEILKDESLWTPVYRADLRTKDDVKAKINDLPLVYIWNENRARGSFTVSVNGVKVEELLESHVDRSDVRFARCRDEISSIVAGFSNESVAETCQRLRRFPSELFISK
jgi:hypothetical protein